MKILFYIEPLFFHNNPFHYWAWLDHSARLVWHMFCHKPRLDGDYRIIMSEALCTRLTKYKHLEEKNIINIRQSEIRGVFQCANMDIVKRIHHQSYTQDQKENLSDLMKKKCGDFIPDLVITYSGAYFLQEAFPDCLIMHTENGPFTRAPYPYTTYYDPLGLYDYSALGRFHKELKNKKENSKDNKLVSFLQAEFKQYLTVKSPFHYLEKKLRKKFDKLFLLPLQTSHTMYYDINGPYNTHTELLYDVIENTPKDVAIILTFHNISHYLKDTLPREHMEYIAEKHPNVIIDNKTNDVNAASQYLLHHVDGCLSVSSSLGVQSLFWDVPLLSPGQSHLQYYAHAKDIPSFWNTLDSYRPKQNNGLLAWLFRNYYIHDCYGVRNPEWMIGFFKKSLEKKRSGELGLEFFDQIDTDEKICETYSKDPLGLRDAVPQFLHGYSQVSRSLHVGSLYQEYNEKKNGNSHGQVNLLMNGDFSVLQTLSGLETEILAGWHLISREAHKLYVSRDDIACYSQVDMDSAVRYTLKIKANEDVFGHITLAQKILNIRKFYGQKVTLSFWVKADPDVVSTIRFQYELFDQSHKNKQTPIVHLLATDEWQRYSHTFEMPEVDNIDSIPLESYLQFFIDIQHLKSQSSIEFAGLVLTMGHNVVPVKKDNLMIDDDICLELS